MAKTPSRLVFLVSAALITPFVGNNLALSEDAPTGATQAQIVDFEFNWSEPLKGEASFQRHQARPGLSDLDSAITWTIHAKPTDKRGEVELTSSAPTLTLGPADLPQDVANQLIVGRNYMMGGLLGSNALFKPTENTKASLQLLYPALTQAGAAIPQPSLGQFIEDSMSEEMLTMTTTENWYSQVGSLNGGRMMIGEPMMAEAPFALPNGTVLRQKQTILLVGLEPCPGSRAAHQCARLRMKAVPAEAMDPAKLNEGAGIAALPEGVTLQAWSLEYDMEHVLEPATLIPHSHKLIKTTEMTLKLPSGETKVQTEVDTEVYTYSWTVGAPEEPGKEPKRALRKSRSEKKEQD